MQKASLVIGALIGSALSAGCSSGGSNKTTNSNTNSQLDPSGLGNCTPATLGPCGSYTFPIEDGGTTTMPLGPYGAQGEVNVGQGFANTVQSSDLPGGESQCQQFASIFMEPPALSNELLATSMNGLTIDFSLYSVYRPAKWPDAPVPVITWGNGTCAQPEGYGALLRYVASYGYFIVAANSRQVGSKNSDGSQPMLRALDYAAAANMDPSSPYYQKLDLTKIGAMGHSQGGQATQLASSDSRIKYVIDFNAEDTGIPKPYLAVSGEADITGFTAAGMMSAIDGAPVPAAYLYYHAPTGSADDFIKGHLVLMLTPDRVAPQTVAWWDMWFGNDAASKADFVGTSCGFCGKGMDPANPYEYGANNLFETGATGAAGEDAGSGNDAGNGSSGSDAGSSSADAGGSPDGGDAGTP